MDQKNHDGPQWVQMPQRIQAQAAELFGRIIPMAVGGIGVGIFMKS
jgi:hypothetical protein